MSNDYYNTSGNPSTGASGSSATMRAEFALIAAAFDKLAALTGNGYKIKRINSGGTAEEAVAGSALFAQDFGLPGVITPSQIAAAQNDYAPTGYATATVYRVSSDASRNITGLAGGASGVIKILENVGAQNIVLKDEDSGSTAANRLRRESVRTRDRRL